MKRIALAALGAVDEDVLSAVEEAIPRIFGVDVRRLAPLPDPAYAFDPQRNQYSSTLVLRDLLGRVPADALRLIAVTERDLFIPMLNFIFGQAQVPGTVAVISAARLRQEFYALRPDAALLRSRGVKEAAHELGHTFGLVHCSDPQCPMSLSANVRQVDAKGAALCGTCSMILQEALAGMRAEAGAETGRGEHR